MLKRVFHKFWESVPYEKPCIFSFFGIKIDLPSSLIFQELLEVLSYLYNSPDRNRELRISQD